MTIVPPPFVDLVDERRRHRAAVAVVGREHGERLRRPAASARCASARLRASPRVRACGTRTGRRCASRPRVDRLSSGTPRLSARAAPRRRPTRRRSGRRSRSTFARASSSTASAERVLVARRADLDRGDALAVGDTGREPEAGDRRLRDPVSACHRAAPPRRRARHRRPRWRRPRSRRAIVRGSPIAARAGAAISRSRCRLGERCRPAPRAARAGSRSRPCSGPCDRRARRTRARAPAARRRRRPPRRARRSARARSASRAGTAGRTPGARRAAGRSSTSRTRTRRGTRCARHRSRSPSRPRRSVTQRDRASRPRSSSRCRGTARARSVRPGSASASITPVSERIATSSLRSLDRGDAGVELGPRHDRVVGEVLDELAELRAVLAVPQELGLGLDEPRPRLRVPVCGHVRDQRLARAPGACGERDHEDQQGERTHDGGNHGSTIARPGRHRNHRASARHQFGVSSGNNDGIPCHARIACSPISSAGSRPSRRVASTTRPPPSSAVAASTARTPTSSRSPRPSPMRAATPTRRSPATSSSSSSGPTTRCRGSASRGSS